MEKSIPQRRELSCRIPLPPPTFSKEIFDGKRRREGEGDEPAVLTVSLEAMCKQWVDIVTPPLIRPPFLWWGLEDQLHETKENKIVWWRNFFEGCLDYVGGNGLLNSYISRILL
ncbi:hypothetical protein TNCV_4788041 [Trichonephila clavipes]|nr:hypothetical protein TNCV_4788041 [Trichonephila clavipes]